MKNYYEDPDLISEENPQGGVNNIYNIFVMVQKEK